jgi:uncharacterized protein YkwD
VSERRGQLAARLPLIAALVVTTFGLPATASYADEPGSGGTGSVVAMVNEERESAGCSPVTVDNRLTEAAEGHSQDQADRKQMTHTGSDGSRVGDRATRAGYSWSRIGENVARTSSAQRAMEMWMASSGHRENILNCAYKHIGVAEVGGYWTQDFGRPR